MLELKLRPELDLSVLQVTDKMTGMKTIEKIQAGMRKRSCGRPVRVRTQYIQCRH